MDTQEMGDVYAFERTWLVLVNVTITGGMFTGATGRRQPNCMCFQPWFYCCDIQSKQWMKSATQSTHTNC